MSPVPLVATATGGHVLAATVYSKSVLRAAAGEVVAKDPGVAYFPAYEIVTGPQAPERYFESDRRNVSREAIDAVMAAFLAHCETDEPPLRVAGDNSANIAADLSRALIEAECEEVMADRRS